MRFVSNLQVRNTVKVAFAMATHCWSMIGRNASDSVPLRRDDQMWFLVRSSFA
jgi:hypothetical protein